MIENLNKILRYGFKIGADSALILDNKLSRYYKKGDKASKYCLYSYTDHNNGRPLRWENALCFDLTMAINTYKTMGKKVEVIQIPKDESALPVGDEINEQL